MHLAVGRMAQGDDLELQAEPLQRQDLLGDEGLRQARVALDQDGDAAGQGDLRVAAAAQLAQRAARPEPGRDQAC